MSERRNITQPADWWAAFEQQAEKDGAVNLSAWIGEQCKAALPKSKQRKLSQRGTVGAPKRPQTEGN